MTFGPHPVPGPANGRDAVRAGAAERPAPPGGDPGTAPDGPQWLGIDLISQRWLFPAAGLVATLVGGSIYAFSVFVAPLEAEFGWSRPQTVLAFAVALVCMALAVLGGGIFVDRFGPRWALGGGGTLAGAGMAASGAADRVGELVVTFGVMVGTGVGLVYSATTVALAARWIPDAARRGTAIGWSVVGFGLGGTVAGPLWTVGIDTVGWRTTYVATGAVFTVVYLALTTLVRFPPPDWRFDADRGWHHLPAHDRAPLGRSQNAHDPTDLTLREALHSRALWLLSITFLLAVIGGLTTISELAPFIEAAQPTGLGATPGTAAALIVIFSLHNGLGRPLSGWASARAGLRHATLGCYLLMAAGMLVLAAATAWNPLVVPGVMVTGLAFGSILALNPTMTVALFGASFVARIYGVVFVVGFGVGGLLGPPLGGAVLDATGSYVPVFVAGAVASILAAGGAIALPDGERQHSARTRAL